MDAIVRYNLMSSNYFLSEFNFAKFGSINLKLWKTYSSISSCNMQQNRSHKQHLMK